jgi:hypothetical protein
MTITATTQGLKPGVCTSTTRPVTPFTGMIIYETDTLLAKVWTGSAWVDYPAGKANIESPTFTGTVALPSTTSIGTVSSTEIGYVDGVTSSIQTQLDSKLTATTAVTSGRNRIVNGNMNVWQRSTDATTTGNNVYATVDRWVNRTGTGAASMRVSRQLSGLAGTVYCSRVQRPSGNTQTGALNMIHIVDSNNSIPLAGQTVTVSFYARAGSGWTSASSTLGLDFVYGTGTDQFWSSFTGGTNIFSTGYVLTSSWQRFTTTATISSSAKELYLFYNFNGVGTAGANDFYEITGVQLEPSAVATPFEYEDYSTTLRKCQRYFYSGTWVGGAAYDDDYLVNYFGGQFPVTMRVTPTLSITSGGLNGHHGVAPTGSAVTADSASFAWAGSNARTGGASCSVTFTANAEM